MVAEGESMGRPRPQKPIKRRLTTQSYTVPCDKACSETMNFWHADPERGVSVSGRGLAGVFSSVFGTGLANW